MKLSCTTKKRDIYITPSISLCLSPWDPLLPSLPSHPQATTHLLSVTIDEFAYSRISPKWSGAGRREYLNFS